MAFSKWIVARPIYLSRGQAAAAARPSPSFVVETHRFAVIYFCFQKVLSATKINMLCLHFLCVYSTGFSIWIRWILNSYCGFVFGIRHFFLHFYTGKKFSSFSMSPLYDLARFSNFQPSPNLKTEPNHRGFFENSRYQRVFENFRYQNVHMFPA